MPYADRSAIGQLITPAILLAVCAVLAAAAGVRAAETAAGEMDPIERRLQERLAANSEDATAWRLLGRLLLERGNAKDARRVLEQAFILDPLSAAAEFDLARALMAIGEEAGAAEHFQHVQELAPDSEYARQAMELSADLPHAGAETQQAGHEIRRFDGTERIPERLPLKEQAQRRFFTDYQITAQLGAQYNSNVALTPLSRDLSGKARDTFQGLFSPDATLDIFESEEWRFGTVFGGDFTLNEGDFQHFNLQSYRPGAFVEADLLYGTTLIVPRIDYEFGLDQFDFGTFATRQEVTASALALWSETHATIGYWSVDHTDFRNDGVAPFVTSRDGWTNAAGVTHEMTLTNRWLNLVRGTAQVEHADARGSDYRYNGVELSAGAVCPLGWGVELECRGGWGFRDYPDFVSGPARNEHILTAGGELRRELGKGFSVAVVAGYDRFISDNVRFDTERVLAGVLLVFER